MGIFDLFSANTGPIRRGYKALGESIPQAKQDITGTTQQAITSLMGGLKPWQTLSKESAGFLPLYAGATGVGTPEQVAAARSAFQASPGYEYTLGQGLEGLSRVGASSGQLGQLNMDAMKYAQNLSDQDFQEWLNNLFRGVGVAEQGAGAAATGGLEKARLQAAQGPELANLTLGKGGLPLQQAQAIQQAQQTAGSNALNALFGLGGLATGALTGFGGAGLGSAVSGLFPGGAANDLSAYLGGSGGWNTTVSPY